MAFAARREEPPVIAVKVVLEKELVQRVVVQPERFAVDPHQVGAFQPAAGDAGAVFRDKAAAELEVAPDQVDCLVEPAFAARIAEAAGLHAERRRGVGVDHVQHGLELFAQDFIRDDDVRGLERRKVEGLARRGADDVVRAAVFTGQRKNRVLVSGHDEVEMDLVAHDQNIVMRADLADLRKLRPAPHAPGGVVRAAQDEHLVFRFGAERFKTVEIDRVVFVVVQKRALDVDAAVLLDRKAERSVNRRHRDDAVARLRVGEHRGEQGGDDAACQNDFLRLDVPAVAVLHPAAHGVVIRFRRRGVAENVRVEVIFQALDDFRRIFQFHVRDRKRGDVRRGVRVVFEHLLPFDRTAVSAGNDGFKIVLHCCFHSQGSLFMRPYCSGSTSRSVKEKVVQSTSPRFVRRSSGRQASGDQRHCHERRLDVAADLLPGLAEVFDERVHLLGRLRVHQAGEGQRHAAEHFAVLHDDLTAAAGDQRVGGKRHILVVRADDEQVVRVVRDRGSHRAALDVEALDEADAVPAGRVMALEDEGLQHVLRRVAFQLAVSTLSCTCRS